MTKDYILQEIRRTARANGGKPLGWRRFSAETGIRESEWLGPYWARWSEALQEAGFPPNAMTSAYDDQQLLSMYADLAMELGRLPTEGDMRVKARNDPDFPHNRPFRRFGSKQQLVERLKQYCETRSDLRPVLQMCENYVPRRRAPEPPAKDNGLANFGVIYLVKSGRHYKIGRSNSAERRTYELSIKLPEPLTVVHVIKTDDPVGIEAYWHERFKAKRVRGEWFDLDSSDVAAFKRRKHFM